MKYKTETIMVLLLILLSIFLFYPDVNQPYPELDQICEFRIAYETDGLDQYGQGISPNGIDALENSTGAWEYYQAFGGIPSSFNVTLDMFVKIRVETRLNSTFTGASSLVEGKNILRHNMTVYDSSSRAVVFQKLNWTYHNSADVSGIYYYSYEVILNFEMTAGAIYEITFTYDIYYLDVI